MKLKEFNLASPLKTSIDQPVGELMSLGSEVNAAVASLADRLRDLAKQASPDLGYSSIDHIMTDICSSHGCKGEDLHDKFIAKHGMTPDEYARTEFKKTRTTHLDDDAVYEQMQPGDVLMVESSSEAVVGTVLSIDGDMIILEGGVYPLNDTELLENQQAAEEIEEAFWPFGKKAAAAPAAAPAATPAAAPASLAAAAPKGAKVKYNGEEFEKAYDGSWESSSFVASPKSFPREWKAIEAEYAKSGNAPAAAKDPFISSYAGGNSVLNRVFGGGVPMHNVGKLLGPRSGNAAVVLRFPNQKFYEIKYSQGEHSIGPSKETQEGYYRLQKTRDGKSWERGDFKPYNVSQTQIGFESMEEAEYHGHQVQLGKPSKGDVKKFRVYVKDPKTGNIKKVNFGDPNMEIKRDDPERRKNFRARHGCGTPRASDRTKAAYWSCRMWSSKPVSKILKGK